MRREQTMKTIILLVSFALSPIVLIADVLTLDRATIARNEDGTISLSFDLSKVPDRAHINLAVLFVDGETLNLPQPVGFTVTGPDKEKVAVGGFGKTRSETAGKQKAQVLLTNAVQQWITEGTKLPELTLRGDSDVGRLALDGAATRENVRLVIYYTLPE